jgi:hypothetical protein
MAKHNRQRRVMRYTARAIAEQMASVRKRTWHAPLPGEVQDGESGRGVKVIDRGGSTLVTREHSGDDGQEGGMAPQALNGMKSRRRRTAGTRGAAVITRGAAIRAEWRRGEKPDGAAGAGSASLAAARCRSERRAERRPAGGGGGGGGVGGWRGEGRGGERRGRRATTGDRRGDGGGVRPCADARRGGVCTQALAAPRPPAMTATSAGSRMAATSSR